VWACIYWQIPCSPYHRSENAVPKQVFCHEYGRCIEYSYKGRWSQISRMWQPGEPAWSCPLQDTIQLGFMWPGDCHSPLPRPKPWSRQRDLLHYFPRVFWRTSIEKQTQRHPDHVIHMDSTLRSKLTNVGQAPYPICQRMVKFVGLCLFRWEKYTVHTVEGLSWRTRVALSLLEWIIFQSTPSWPPPTSSSAISETFLNIL